MFSRGTLGINPHFLRTMALAVWLTGGGVLPVSAQSTLLWVCDHDNLAHSTPAQQESRDTCPPKQNLTEIPMLQKDDSFPSLLHQVQGTIGEKVFYN